MQKFRILFTALIVSLSAFNIKAAQPKKECNVVTESLGSSRKPDVFRFDDMAQSLQETVWLYHKDSYPRKNNFIGGFLSLCKLKNVCKKWNTLLTQRK